MIAFLADGIANQFTEKFQGVFPQNPGKNRKLPVVPLQAGVRLFARQAGRSGNGQIQALRPSPSYGRSIDGVLRMARVELRNKVRIYSHARTVVTDGEQDVDRIGTRQTWRH